MVDQNIIGNQGEDSAVKFLFANGYDVLHRNYRVGRAEVDIIARKDNCICFVEVKTRKNSNLGYPESFLSDAQKERIHHVAETYIQKNDWHGDIQFDIIAIVKDGSSPIQLEHFEDAF